MERKNKNRILSKRIKEYLSKVDERIKELGWLALRVAFATSFQPALAASPKSYSSAQYPNNETSL